MQQPIKYQSHLRAIPNGRAGVQVTLQIMRKMANKGKLSSPVRLTALRLISDLPQKDRYAEVQRIFDFVKNGIRYVYDINDVETLHEPQTLLQLKQGDCDDKSILLASLLESVGYKTRFKAVAANSEKINHVYTEVFVNGKWWALDSTENVEPGWSPPVIRDSITVSGLGGFSFSKFVKKATGGFIQDITGTTLIEKVTGINIYTDTMIGIDPLMLWKNYKEEIKKYSKIIGPIAASFIPYVGPFIAAAMIAAQAVYDQAKRLEAQEKAAKIKKQNAILLQAKIDSGEVVPITSAGGQTMFIAADIVTPVNEEKITGDIVNEEKKRAFGLGTIAAVAVAAFAVLG